MKNLIGLTLALALVLSVAPVMAGESFEGMDSLSSAVAALPDADLAKVEGQGAEAIQVCVDCTNVAEVEQEVEITQVIKGCCNGNGGLNIQSAEVEVESEIIQFNNGAFVEF